MIHSSVNLGFFNINRLFMSVLLGQTDVKPEDKTAKTKNDEFVPAKESEKQEKIEEKKVQNKDGSYVLIKSVDGKPFKVEYFSKEGKLRSWTEFKLEESNGETTVTEDSTNFDEKGNVDSYYKVIIKGREHVLEKYDSNKRLTEKKIILYEENDGRKEVTGFERIQEFSPNGIKAIDEDFKAGTKDFYRNGKLFCRVSTNEKALISDIGKIILSKDSLEVLGKLIAFGEVKLTEAQQKQFYDAGIKVLKVNERIKALEDKYKVKIKLDCVLKGAKALTDPVRIHENLEELEIEMEKYPPGFFQKIGLKHINFFSEINNSNSKTKHTGGQYRHGENAIDLVEVKFAFDHELYHYLDLSKRSMYNRDGLTNTTMDDEKFKATHPAGYTGKKGHEWYDNMEKEDPAYEPTGFVRSYGRTNVDEDQATFAEQLFKVDGEKSSRHLHHRAIADSILGRKIKLIKADYKNWDSRLNDQFFRDIQNGVIINQEYWAKRSSK